VLSRAKWVYQWLKLNGSWPPTWRAADQAQAQPLLYRARPKVTGHGPAQAQPAYLHRKWASWLGNNCFTKSICSTKHWTGVNWQKTWCCAKVCNRIPHRAPEENHVSIIENCKIPAAKVSQCLLLLLPRPFCRTCTWTRRPSGPGDFPDDGSNLFLWKATVQAHDDGYTRSSVNK
jgi:hypothetical protein